MRQISYLVVAQLLSFSVVTMMVVASSLVGLALSPLPELATLPLSLQVAAFAAALIPATRFMQRFGRRRVMLVMNMAASLSLVLCIVAVLSQSFILFCLGSGLLGGSLAYIQQLRFVAIEAVTDPQQSVALSWIMMAGIGAAFLGPELTTLGQLITQTNWIGSYSLGVVCLVLTFLLLHRYLPTTVPCSSDSKEAAKSKVRPALIVVLCAGALGGALMTLIMTATPITMHHHNGFDLESTTRVIQWHIVAMFAPSLLTSRLLKIISIRQMMGLGALIIAVCAYIGFYAADYSQFVLSLVLLGVGWNFLFMGSTLLLPTLSPGNEKLRFQGYLDGSAATLQAIGTLTAGALLHFAGWTSILAFSGLVAIGVALSLTIKRFH
ncbi:MFS transporter [uncultured Umboniibacter sp.]|uniref:MFS transporter n=1 Tax=uncultured Umboniibacter sp. TaxID=1798917 RepID=UPI0026209A2D|nr:MFS transporter [uncultured Umboniibacter sp.]